MSPFQGFRLRDNYSYTGLCPVFRYYTLSGLKTKNRNRNPRTEKSPERMFSLSDGQSTSEIEILVHRKRNSRTVTKP